MSHPLHCCLHCANLCQHWGGAGAGVGGGGGSYIDGKEKSQCLKAASELPETTLHGVSTRLSSVGVTDESQLQGTIVGLFDRKEDGLDLALNAALLPVSWYPTHHITTGRTLYFSCYIC